MAIIRLKLETGFMERIERRPADQGRVLTLSRQREMVAGAHKLESEFLERRQHAPLGRLDGKLHA